MLDITVGDQVRITDEENPHYDQIGNAVRKVDTGGWWILFPTANEPIYLPWGYDKVIHQKRGEEDDLPIPEILLKNKPLDGTSSYRVNEGVFRVIGKEGEE